MQSLGPASRTALAIVDDLDILESFGGDTALQNTLLKTGTEVLHVIAKAAYAQCTDPRDRVYGILGMTAMGSISKRLAQWQRPAEGSSASNPYLRVDYSRSASEVFVDLTRWIATATRSLDILLLEGNYGGVVDGKPLPSWCPNWNFRHDDSVLRIIGRAHYQVPRRLDNVLENWVEPPFRLHSRKLHGFINFYGTISRIKMPEGDDWKKVVVEPSGIGPRNSLRIFSRSVEVLLFGQASLGDVVGRLKGCRAPLVLAKQSEIAWALIGFVDMDNGEPWDYLKIGDGDLHDWQYNEEVDII